MKVFEATRDTDNLQEDDQWEFPGPGWYLQSQADLLAGFSEDTAPPGHCHKEEIPWQGVAPRRGICQGIPKHLGGSKYAKPSSRDAGANLF
jgi:hypothetical protein